jgi:threonylcarbamoyladenosine tRNA methylthiotransferase MtaB
MSQKTFKIYTLGCKVNQYESFCIRYDLTRDGFREKEMDCDLIIVNTCAVTNTACHQSRQSISKLMGENPRADIIITGCYVDLYPDELANKFKKAILIQNSYKLRMPEIIRGGPSLPKGLAPCWFPHVPPLQEGRGRAYLKIQDGCEANCSYCVVPTARGGYKSLARDLVVCQSKELERRGFKEVVLTGIHLGKYGVDRGEEGLVDVIEDVLKGSDVMKLRISSLEPAEVTDALLRVFINSCRLNKHFHIPLQSGSEKILSLMERDYSPKFYKDLIWEIKRLMPQAGIGADVIVGFPGEDDECFEETLNLIKELPLSYLHVFPYSERNGTKAKDFANKVPIGVKKKRATILRALGDEKKREFLHSHIGKYVEILVEKKAPDGRLFGHTDNYLMGVVESAGPDVLGMWLGGRVERVEDGVLVVKGVSVIS